MKWIDIVISFAGTGTGLYLIKLTIDGIKKWHRSQTIGSIKSAAQIYAAMQSISGPEVMRVSIVKCHNGKSGKGSFSATALTPKTHKYISVLYEEPKRDTIPIIHDIQHWVQDKVLTDIISKLSMEGEYLFKVCDLDNSRWKSYYMATEPHPTKVIWKIFIGADRSAIYYMSISSDNDIEQFSPTTQRQTYIAANKIIKLMGFN